MDIEEYLRQQELRQQLYESNFNRNRLVDPNWGGGKFGSPSAYPGLPVEALLGGAGAYGAARAIPHLSRGVGAASTALNPVAQTIPRIPGKAWRSFIDMQGPLRPWVVGRLGEWLDTRYGYGSPDWLKEMEIKRRAWEARQAERQAVTDKIYQDAEARKERIMAPYRRAASEMGDLQTSPDGTVVYMPKRPGEPNYPGEPDWITDFRRDNPHHPWVQDVPAEYHESLDPRRDMERREQERILQGLPKNVTPMNASEKAARRREYLWVLGKLEQLRGEGASQSFIDGFLKHAEVKVADDPAEALHGAEIARDLGVRTRIPIIISREVVQRFYPPSGEVIKFPR